ncbi:MAG: hypothetical protein P8M20_13840 [Planctomycetaceae bacterium]|nr:hypothetical protein [Planctomycetaceae bacterium]
MSTKTVRDCVFPSAKISFGATGSPFTGVLTTLARSAAFDVPVGFPGQGGYRGPARFWKLVFPRWGDLVYIDE